MKHLARLLILLYAGAFSAVAEAQSRPPFVAWSMTLPDEEQNVADLATDSAGNFVVGSQRFLSLIYEGKSFLTKYDQAGSELWQKEFQAQFIGDLLIDASDNTYTLGSFHNSSAYRGTWLGKYASDGTEVWAQYQPYDYTDRTSFTSLARDAAGSLYAAGTKYELTEEGESTDQQIILQKWSSLGEPIWTREFGGETGDSGRSLAIDGSGNVYVMGYTDGYTLAGEEVAFGSVLFSKFDPKGNQLWQRTLAGEGSVYSDAFAVDEAGNIFIGGQTDAQLGEMSFGEGDGFISRWNSAGEEVWTKQFGSWSYDIVRAISISSEGGLLVSGYNGISGPSAFTYLSQLDYDGETEWITKKPIPFYTPREVINQIAEGAEGSLYVAATRGHIPYEGFIERLEFPSADFNDDGSIDGGDFLAWQRGLGMTDAALSDGDANGDSVVDAEDLAIWQEQYEGGNALSAVNVVPEPSVAGLMTMLLILVSGKRRAIVAW